MFRHLPDNVTADDVFDALRLAPLLHSLFVGSSDEKDKLVTLQKVLDLNDINIPTLFRKVLVFLIPTSIYCLWPLPYIHFF